MRVIYHLVPRADWEAAPPGPYAPASLSSEGIVHCSGAAQVERVANLFYASALDLLVLSIDADWLGPLVRDEEPAGAPADNPFPGETFPHVLGPIDRDAILAVRPLSRGPGGTWVLPPS